MPLNIRVDIHHHFHGTPAGDNTQVAGRLNQLAQRMKRSSDALADAVGNVVGKQPSGTSRFHCKGDSSMSTNPIEQAIANVEAEVTRNDSIDSSAVALISGLASQIEQYKNSPTQLQALADRMRASSDALATAIAANTPSEGGEGTPQA